MELLNPPDIKPTAASLKEGAKYSGKVATTAVLVVAGLGVFGLALPYLAKAPLVGQLWSTGARGVNVRLGDYGEPVVG